MLEYTFTSDRRGEMLYIYSNLWGFYLCGTVHERVIASIVPLVQHLFWQNEQKCVEMQKSDVSIFELLKRDSLILRFVEVEKLEAPTIPQDGAWYVHETTNRSFFLPLHSDGNVDATIVCKITTDRERENTGIQQ